MNYFLDTLKNHYADFSGRARRSEYWYFTLFNMLGSIAISILTVALSAVSESLGLIGTVLYFGWAIGLIVPGLGVAIRRLHDTGKSGWWLLIGLVPVIGLIALIVFMCTDSDPGVNAFGPNPKEENYSVADHLVE